MRPTALLLTLLTRSPWVMADDVAPAAAAATAVETPSEAATRSDKARADGERRRAEERYRLDKDACLTKTLMNACLDDARQTRNATTLATRKLDAEARELDYRQRRREADEHEARRQARLPRHELEASKDAERNRADQEEAMRRVERRLAEKAEKTGGN